MPQEADFSEFWKVSSAPSLKAPPETGVSVGGYRVAKTHRMPYLHRSFSAKEPYLISDSFTERDLQLKASMGLRHPVIRWIENYSVWMLSPQNSEKSALLRLLRHLKAYYPPTVRLEKSALLRLSRHRLCLKRRRRADFSRRTVGGSVP